MNKVARVEQVYSSRDRFISAFPNSQPINVQSCRKIFNGLVVDAVPDRCACQQAFAQHNVARIRPHGNLRMLRYNRPWNNSYRGTNCHEPQLINYNSNY